MIARVGFLVVSMMLASSACYAGETEDFLFATEAGQVIGSSDAGGYKLDAAKVAAFSEMRIANLGQMARMNFSSASIIQADSIATMTETQKVSHCALNQALAKMLELL
jgi:hypothetical protein